MTEPTRPAKYPTRSVEDFKAAAAEWSIGKWDHHDCGGCGYMCKYVFARDGGTVWFDPGCDCTWVGWQERSWQEVADHYNRQYTPAVLDRMAKFWHFPEGEVTDV
jgi:hypothetical protein